MSTHKRMDEQTVVYQGIQLSRRNKGLAHATKQMNLQTVCGMKKPCSKEEMLCDSIHMKLQNVEQQI